VARAVQQLARLRPDDVRVTTTTPVEVRATSRNRRFGAAVVGASELTALTATNALIGGAVSAFHVERLGGKAASSTGWSAAVDHFDAPFLLRAAPSDAKVVHAIAEPFHLGWGRSATGQDPVDVSTIRGFFDRHGIFTPDLDADRGPGFIGPVG